MKNLFLIIILSFCSSSIAQDFNPYGANRIVTNQFGTRYYYNNGRYSGMSRPNVLGGRNYYDTNSRFSQSYRSGNQSQYRGRR